MGIQMEMKVLGVAAVMVAASFIGVHAAPRVGATAVAHPASFALKAVKVKTNYIVSGSSGGALSTGFNTIKSISVSCPGTKPCTLVMSAMDSIGVCSAGGNWAIVVVVDGASVDGAPYQGRQPLGSNFLTGNWQGYFATTPGAHVVELISYIGSSSTSCAQGSYALNVGVALP